MNFDVKDVILYNTNSYEPIWSAPAASIKMEVDYSSLAKEKLSFDVNTSATFSVEINSINLDFLYYTNPLNKTFTITQEVPIMIQAR